MRRLDEVRRRGPTGRFASRALGAFALVALLFGVATPLGPAAAETDSRVYRCSFTDGTVRALEDGKFAITKAGDLVFDIGAIDLAAQTAQLITTTGSDQLRIVRAINANHFLEVVTEGFLNMTTIYAPMATGEPSPAVHSRHFGLLGQPVIAQYSGFCEELK